MTARSNLKANKRLDKIKEDSFEDESSQDYSATVIDTVYRTSAKQGRPQKWEKSGTSTIAPKLQNLLELNRQNRENTNNFQSLP